MELGDSLASTPTWAVAVVATGLIIIALLIEHALHLLTHFLNKRKRKTLNQALNHIKAELRNLGFMSLLLTMAKQPISKICIPSKLSDSFLPCKSDNQTIFDEVESCQAQGKVSLVSEAGTQQLQLLIFILAVFHVFSCLATMGLGEVKMKRWKFWEGETRTMQYQLSNDPRRLIDSHQTSFGKRHLKLWSKNYLLLWLVCFMRQFTDSVSKADYFALRHGFLTVHFHTDSNYNFHKFLKRSLDHDFMAVVRISTWVWIYAVLFIFFNAHGFYNHFWSPIIPLVLLLIVGMKLEVIITTMCVNSSQEGVLVPGILCVRPDNKLFWFGRPRFLLHMIHFILIQNSFHLAFFTWAWYSFGFRSCFHSESQEIVLGITVGVIVQFLCAYVTLPLHALVTQMGSSMNKSIFADQVIEGLKNWQRMAKKRIEEKKVSSTPSTPSTPSREPSPPLTSEEASTSNKIFSTPSPSLTPSREPSPSLTSDRASSSNERLRSIPKFKYPSGRLELLEVQRVVEEIIQGGPNSSRYTGEVSFRLWKKQGSQPSPRPRS